VYDGYKLTRVASLSTNVFMALPMKHNIHGKPTFNACKRTIQKYKSIGNLQPSATKTHELQIGTKHLK
jgi:hypothetical protein